MTTEQTGERELPEDMRRKQIQVTETLRSYLQEKTQGEGKTYSQQMKEWLPEDTEDIHFGYTDRDVVQVKATPDVHAEVVGMTGDRVDAGEVLAYYALLSALKEGDYEVAAGLAKQIPDLLLDAMVEEGLGDV